MSFCRVLAALLFCGFAITSADARPAKWCGCFLLHNDGGAIRERVREVSGATMFRWPS